MCTTTCIALLNYPLNFINNFAFSLHPFLLSEQNHGVAKERNAQHTKSIVVKMQRYMTFGT